MHLPFAWVSGHVTQLAPAMLSGGSVVTMAGQEPALAACAATDTGTACDGPDDATLTAPIGGAGRLSKAGSGTVTLSAGNTYAGGTSLAAGILAVANPGTLGAPDGALHFWQIRTPSAPVISRRRW